MLQFYADDCVKNAACCPEAFWGIVLEYSSVIEVGQLGLQLL